MVKVETSPIKIHKTTHGKLLRVLGEIQQKSDDRITVNTTILKLIESWGGKK